MESEEVLGIFVATSLFSLKYGIYKKTLADASATDFYVRSNIETIRTSTQKAFDW